MVSRTGYQLSGLEGNDGQINYWTFEYAGTEKYGNKEYFKYVFADKGWYILTPTRNITKVTFPFDDYYISADGEIIPLLGTGWDSLYGFTSVPENKILMKRRTDIGTNANGKDYIDFGLTSGTLWATMNVGATSETDYGSYFQWGDTVDKRDAVCNWSTYKYCNGSNRTLTKYCTRSSYGTVDNKLTLDLEDDAARANMKGDWRMPSAALMEELVFETNNMSATINGVKGWKFTSKTDESKYIFIPASGYRPGSSFLGRNYYIRLWCSSLDTLSNEGAGQLGFDSDSIDVTTGGSRSDGEVVRGVL